MKAYVFTEKGKIEPKELPAPVLDPKDPEDAFAAILKPRYLAPCSSDVHTVYAGPGPRREDLVLGHEGIAEVVAAGEKVRDFHPGDLVAVSAVMPEIPGGNGHEGSHFSASKLGRNIDGMWSELFKVPFADQNLAKIPEGVSMEAALMAVDMMATGYTAAAEVLGPRAAFRNNAIDIKKKCEKGSAGDSGERSESPAAADYPIWEDDALCGRSVLVIGSGAVGLMAVAAAHSMGAEEILVIGTDKDPLNRELAIQYGAGTYISYRDGRILYDRHMESVSSGCAASPRIHETDASPSPNRARLAEFKSEHKETVSHGCAASPRIHETNASPSPNRARLAEFQSIDPRANATSDPAVDTVLQLTRGEGVDCILICGGGPDVYIQACDMLRYGSGICVNVAYIEGTGTVGLPIFSLGRGMAGKTFIFTLSRGGRSWTERMLSEISSGRTDPSGLVTHHMKGFDQIPKALEMMHRRPKGLIKIMVEV